MSKMIQIRHVPDETHQLLKRRAKSMGLTLSEYVLRTVAHAAAAPTDDEIMARLTALEPVRSDESSTASLQEVREARDAYRSDGGM